MSILLLRESSDSKGDKGPQAWVSPALGCDETVTVDPRHLRWHLGLGPEPERLLIVPAFPGVVDRFEPLVVRDGEVVWPWGPPPAMTRE
ncbi:hypothetical protein GCM10010260_38460 [Streptomyces filipinensis]|uniref:Uncharacterized protein n=1 Tax=Streptomyces filipinensis TaxID=66887 RepID=A0A918IBT4_9ACTN|nr:hypothetical protein GCM10010260_38460 [Streptomyces filipinensis]